jgi:hypothetical protein
VQYDQMYHLENSPLDEYQMDEPSYKNLDRELVASANEWSSIQKVGFQSAIDSELV